jgi:hypothetical protein
MATVKARKNRVCDSELRSAGLRRAREGGRQQGEEHEEEREAADDLDVRLDGDAEPGGRLTFQDQGGERQRGHGTPSTEY